MIIYHGSEFIIEKPVFGEGKVYNDYGLGFYCTEHKDLACEWAVNSERDGYCNTYELDTRGLTILELNGMHSILHWITILLENRSFDIQTDFARDAMIYLTENFGTDYQNVDVMIGYRADDSYFTYASDFLNNAISVQTLYKAMRLGTLGEQIVLKSEKAFDQIQFIGADEAIAAEWFGKKIERDKKARAGYKELRKQPWSKSELFIRDILVQEVKANDERVRL